MPSTQRYLANNRNVLLGAALSASSVAAIENAVLEKPLARSGSARVSLSGTYTGQEKAQYEIEIVDTAVENPLISQPVFAGAGTGEIVDIAFAGTAQTFTVKLADLGQVLRAAGTDMESASLVARMPGANGNLIHLSVDQSGLTYTAQNFSLIEEIKLGADGVEGPQYDWDTKIMGADGKIPADAHRITFGDDTSTVYRQYKQYKGGKWLYHFEPPLNNDFPAGARIKFVTGGRTVTVTDGTTTEVYTGIVTLYDLLSSLQTGSGLIAVNGVVANDRAPGGMAARDLSTRTDAHFMPSYGRGSASAVGMVNCAVMPGAYTELVVAKCWANSSKDSPDAGIGRELWQVAGSVSGVVATALQTGTPLTTDQFSLTIPTKLPDGFGVQRGRFSVERINYVTRDLAAGEIEPPICIDKSLAIGPEAVDQTITLTWSARPASGSCGCDDMPVPDLSARQCLTGKINLTEGDGIMKPAQLSRLSRLGSWYRDAVASNTSIGGDGELKSAKFDIELFKRARDEFEGCLTDIYGSQGELHFGAWAPLAAIDRYTMIEALDTVFMAQNTGTTGATSPTFQSYSTNPNQSITDGDVNWISVSLVPESMWDAALEALKTDALVLATMSDGSLETATEITSGSTVTAGQIVRIPENPRRFRVLEAGTFGTAGLVFSIPGTADPVAAGLTAISGQVGLLYSPLGGGSVLRAVVLDDAGVLTSSADIDTPNYSSGGINGAIDDFVNRYKSSMDAVRAAAGITKKAEASTVAGDNCWRDNNDAYWWKVVGSVGGEYAPAFNNEPYMGSRSACGGAYFSTHEFAFQVNVKCPEALKVGDTITLAMGDSGWPSTYQVGDVLYLPVIAAQDLYLAGGNDGDNVQTWHIDGSVDGPFPAYLNDLDLPTPYSANGLQFQINAGGIAFEAGDLYKFSVEGGHWRWRKDAGAWSLPSPVTGVGAALSDGLSATFTTGAAPSFAAGDLYRFRALQPSALSNVVNPDTDAWRWSGAGATLTANLGSSQTIDCASLAFHTLPSGATVTLYGGADGVTWDWSEAITWRAGAMAKLFASYTATFLKFEIAGASGGSIGWAWAGQALSTEYSAECLLRRDYSVERSAGLNPSAAFLGATRSGEIEWRQGVLTDTDMSGIMAMLDHLKENDDEPMVLIPQSTRPEEAWPVRVTLDSIDMPEDGGYQPNTGKDRRYSMKLSVSGVVA